MKYIKTYTLTYILTDKFDKMNAKSNEMQTLNLEKNINTLNNQISKNYQLADSII